MRKAMGLVCASLVLIAAAAGANRQTTTAEVRIPFDFMVGRHMFPAGEYRVHPAGVNTVRLEAVRGIAAVMMTANPARPVASAPFRLVFDNEEHPRQLLAVYGAREINAKLAAYRSRSLTVITTNPAPALASDRGVQQY